MTEFARFRFLPAGAMPRRMLLLSTVLCVLLAGGFLWWRSDGRVPPPVPDARGAALCRALDRALPHSLQGRARRDPQPSSPYTAAWRSDPRTVLKCGVPVPPVLLEQRELDGATVNDVDWLIEKLDGGDYRFTTVERRTTVEVTVRAGAYANPTDVLPQLSDAVAKTVPSRFTQ
ncbi:DUF3515 domain-containing protein [Peterkaempfera bronchialis]|uniref:DUF3515 domain-containing protein n=1 Tax=Peterkaempfera bronchialis TaxID=2126346 RepID=A0A345T0T3_9ACTN|nr:DUF3515 domain-containing protein [Peterkaempfera bronchialis]AXI79588.1 DUF3515 domain-containing protein [Peterkaempfera bronchialis]